MHKEEYPQYSFFSALGDDMDSQVTKSFAFSKTKGEKTFSVKPKTENYEVVIPKLKVSFPLIPSALSPPQRLINTPNKR